MQANEIEELTGIFVSLGVRKIRLTGGEPLLRKDTPDIIRRLRKFDTEISLTTNGYLLDHYVDDLKAAEIHSINISLDTFGHDRFREIARFDGAEKVLGNIQMMLREGFDVKLNVVPMRGINDDELQDFIAFTESNPVHVRFIEYMPFSANNWQENRMISSEEILERISQHYDIIKLHDEVHDTSRKYKVPGFAGDFGMISTVTEPFCHECNRMRLTADGKMRNCLFAQQDTDLLTALRRGEDVIPLIHSNLQRKAKQYGGQEMVQEIKNSNMILIGG